MRYIPHTDEDRAEMLAALHITETQQLFSDIPPAARLGRPLDVPGPLTEMELIQRMRQEAAKNRSVDELVCFLGGQFYDRFIPSAVAALVGRGEFATSYTPYQPELSQGTLAAIYEFQSMMAGLTGLDAAQASMYDGASAAAEAALMALDTTGRSSVVVDRGVNADSRLVAETYVAARGGSVQRPVPGQDLHELLDQLKDPPAAVMVQQPDVFGNVRDLRPVAAWAHAHGALAIAVADPVALAVVEPPGRMGFDVVVGEGQPLGNGLQYGGPTFGFFAASQALVRRIPGRVVGATRDVDGRRGFVLTLQAREQHIRRERATSNICSNHSLNALAATVYLSLLGPEGLREVARLSAAKAHYLVNRLEGLGLSRYMPDGPYLFEVAMQVPGSVADLNRHLLGRRILGGFDMEQWDPAWAGGWQLAVTEQRTREELDRLVEEVSAWL
jgi:glycine dehydrogenase subunit 1